MTRQALADVAAVAVGAIQLKTHCCSLWVVDAIVKGLPPPLAEVVAGRRVQRATERPDTGEVKVSLHINIAETAEWSQECLKSKTSVGGLIENTGNTMSI